MDSENEYESKIFTILESAINNSTIDNYNIYNICENNEKLTMFKLSNGNISFKVLKNNILLKYCRMKKSKDTIEIRNIPNIEKKIKCKFSDVKCTNDNLYLKISIENINDIKLLSNEISDIFKYLFLQYINSEASFGCCSRYNECSDKLQCTNNNVRFRLSCMYKKNLDNGKIFYGKNKNV